MCSMRFLLATIVIGVFVFGGVGALLASLLQNVEDEVEEDISSLINKYRGGQGVEEEEKVIPSFPCECYDVLTAKNISLEKTLNIYDLDFRSDIITVKYQPNKVQLIWGLKKTQKEGVAGPLYYFNYANWDGEDCYKVSTVRTVEPIKKLVGKWTLMTSPYKLILKGYELVCDGDCRMGVLHYYCED